MSINVILNIVFVMFIVVIFEPILMYLAYCKGKDYGIRMEDQHNDFLMQSKICRIDKLTRDIEYYKSSLAEAEDIIVKMKEDDKDPNICTDCRNYIPVQRIVEED